ncbi:MAG: hypothetical protein JXL97_03990 [Bacteroidales bacterium]|nr:hypothetical protein [Bacteroidales bacterium]
MNILLKWKDEYSVNIPNIDLQHKNFFNILNRLYTAILDANTKSVVEIIIEEMFFRIPF